METKGMKEFSFKIDTAGMFFNQTKQFVYLGGKSYEDGSVEDDINHRVQRARAFFQRISQAMHDRRDSPLRLARFDSSNPKSWRPYSTGVAHMEDGASRIKKQAPSNLPPLPSALHRMEKEGEKDRAPPYAEALTKARCDE